MEIGAIHKLMIVDMKEYVDTARKVGGPMDLTFGKLTPAKRFEKDSDVPRTTRYEVPEKVLNASLGASPEEVKLLDDWDRQFSEANFKLSQESSNTLSGTG